MKINRDSDSDPCPISDEMLGKLYRAHKDGLPALIANVRPGIRASLASYCYRRGHLQDIGLAIASTCDEHDLVTWGGTAGTALFVRSREAASVALPPSRYMARQRVTLASGPLRKNMPIDHDGDDEPDLPGGSK
jgi:hypothetical protein